MKSENSTCPVPTLIFPFLVATALSLTACGGEGALSSSGGKTSARYGLTPGSAPGQFTAGSSYQWKMTVTQGATQTVYYQKMAILKVTSDELTFKTSSSPTPVFFPGAPGETMRVKFSDASCTTANGSTTDDCALPYFMFKKMSALMSHGRKTIASGTYATYQVVTAGQTESTTPKLYWGDETGPLQNCLIYAQFPSDSSTTATPGNGAGSSEIELIKYDPRN